MSFFEVFIVWARFLFLEVIVFVVILRIDLSKRGKLENLIYRNLVEIEEGWFYCVGCRFLFCCDFCEGGDFI